MPTASFLRQEVGARRSSSPPAAPSPVELIGREQQLSALAEHLEAAAAGSARVVVISGEAGSGKTSLVEAFRAEHGVHCDVWLGHSAGRR